MMKKIMRISSFFLIMLFLAGCTKKEEKELLPVSKEEFAYTVDENTAAFTVDEEGTLYTVTGKLPELIEGIVSEKEYQLQYATQTFTTYDLNGTCISQKELSFGMGAVSLMAVDDGKLYCIVPINMESYVYVVDTRTWEVTELVRLYDYQYVNDIVLLDNYLYVIGMMNHVESKTYSLHPDVYSFDYKNEKISRINVTEASPKLERMKVDFPIGMYATEQNTLMIYQYTEEKGFGFLEFNPAALSLEEKEWSHVKSARMDLGGCGEGYVYTENDKLYYGTTEGKKVQLSPDEIRLYRPTVYQKGFLFLLDSNAFGKIERFCVSEKIKENKEIRMLTDQFATDMPYGCGYQMSTYPVTADEFALKVLAQDRDFDVYLLNSREDCAYNLKKNGAFYALNDVEGVQEYLDACFPYVKELAVNEEGDIWMIPVALAIPGLIYNKELCEENKIDYSQMDYLEFLNFLEKTESETPELTSMSLIVIIEQLFMQYLAKYDSFDTEILRTYLTKLNEIYAEHGDWGINSVYGRSLVEKTAARFYLDYIVYSFGFATVANRIGDADYYGIAATPKLSPEIGNMGTITFLAVNPKSDNLKDTLKYISDYCRYMLTRQDSFILADESMYTDTPFIKEQYQLYADGDINFRMDYEIFLEDFGAYIRGEVGLEEAITEAERKRKIYMGE